MRNLREWSYGQSNPVTANILYEEIVFAPEEDETVLEVVLKKLNVSIPFDAQVRFEGVNF